MSTPMKIDFVSDVVCPWCAVGLGALQEAIARVGSEVSVQLHFQPFELNPQMPAAGEDVYEHLAAKYGGTREQMEQNGHAIRDRGASVGFTFNMDKRTRIFNTFDAHRLIHWAGTQGEAPQLALKQALLKAYFTEGRNVGDHDVLVAVAGETGLDAAEARAILVNGTYADDVRAQEAFFVQQGIRAVPAVVINDRHLISGGQPVETFESALRQIAAQG